MKKIITTGLGLMCLTLANAQALECQYKEIANSKIRFVYPVYKASVTYFFDKNEKNAYALANWEFDQERTRECFNAGKVEFPGSEHLIPPVSVSEVKLRVLGAADYISYEVFPMANGHWSASSRMIPIQYSAKEAITEALAQNDPMVDFIGNPRMRITYKERGSVGKIKCTDKEEEGVLKLYARMGEIKKSAESLLQKGVKPEEVLQDFLGKCVEFLELDEKLNSKINQGELTLMGQVLRESYQEMSGIAHEDVAIRNI